MNQIRYVKLRIFYFTIYKHYLVHITYHNSLILQVGSASVQGAGAPTMFQAMRRIVDCLAHEYMGEGAFERAIRSSFLGMIFS